MGKEEFKDLVKTSQKHMGMQDIMLINQKCRQDSGHRKIYNLCNWLCVMPTGKDSFILITETVSLKIFSKNKTKNNKCSQKLWY